jgi:ABC-type Fe3+ transport system permease subunit
MMMRWGALMADRIGDTSTRARSSYTDLALCGALLGAMLMLAFNVWNIPSDRIVATDPFLHVMGETIGSAAAGAVLSVVLGLVHHLLLHRM